MTKLRNDRFIRALNRQPVDRTPAWIMRQAGRYMPEYRALRERAGNFLALCKNPEMACAATMLPIQQYNLDAAIVFSDILLIPEAMGLGLEFVADEGPLFAKTIRSAADVDQLRDVDPQKDLGYVNDAIKLIVRELDNSVPLIGFAGSPWTVASYMVEGQTAKHFYKLKGLMFQAPQVLHKLLAHMSKQITRALQAQIDAGVNVIMLFDTWGGILNDAAYQEFSLRYMADIVRDLKRDNPTVPVILFTKNGGRCLSAMAAVGCDAIGLDWTANLADAKAQVGQQVALQGNMDPCTLYASPERIVEEVKNVLAQFGSGTGHIFNLGHGIPMDVKPENVQVMLDAVHTYSPAYHQPLVTA
ncbi:MAG TPA: uroporphyrinogen decarboxylase [Gammaproteobacteria bacterium]|nr:uroporphyrinogen decarboxylase [Gammaproteobacteria bacterium]